METLFLVNGDVLLQCRAIKKKGKKNRNLSTNLDTKLGYEK